ncbi:MAG: hypothetical protein Q9181_002615 [Wetmoreana brouardii]
MKVNGLGYEVREIRQTSFESLQTSNESLMITKAIFAKMEKAEEKQKEKTPPIQREIAHEAADPSLFSPAAAPTNQPPTNQLPADQSEAAKQDDHIAMLTRILQKLDGKLDEKTGLSPLFSAPNQPTHLQNPIPPPIPNASKLPSPAEPQHHYQTRFEPHMRGLLEERFGA